MESLAELNSQLRKAPPGRLVARAARAIALADGNPMRASEIATERRWIEAGVIKASVPALNATGMSGLTGGIGTALIEYISAFTVVDRLRNIRRIPANVVGASVTQPATGFWGNGVGAAIGTSQLTVDDGTAGLMREQRVSGIAVFVKELLRSQSVSVDDVVSRALRDAVVVALDSAFLDPQNSGSPELSPASITSAAPSFTSAGPSATAIAADLKKCALSIVNSGGDLRDAVWVVSKRTAISLASMSESASVFRGCTANGGTLMGLDVLVTGELVFRGSPDSTQVILLDPSNIFLVDERNAEISRSTVATLEMDNQPSGSSFTPTAASMVSLFQSDSVAVKATRWCNWKPTSYAKACAYIESCEY
jgi:Phage capsid family